jgi:hypothetical protein
MVFLYEANMTNETPTNEKIHHFLETWKDLPLQGTKAWLKGRLTTIGGSELKNAVKDPARLMASKLGLLPRFNSPYMTWGNVMEDQCRLITEWLFNTTVYEAGSVPSCLMPRKTFSMDGICMVPFNLGLNIPNDEAEVIEFKTVGTKKLITIVEYKSPSRYIPIQNKIPPQYVDQINSGLSDVAIAEIGLFIEFAFRLAPISSLSKGNTEYNRDYHDFKKVDNLGDTPGDPLVWGIMGLYITTLDPEGDELPSDVDMDQVDKIIHKLVSMASKKIMDLCSLNYHEIVLLYKLMKSQYIKIWHFPLHTDNDALYNNVDYIRYHNVPLITASTTPIAWHFKQMTKHVKSLDGYSLGFFGWKTFKFNIVPVAKDPQYTAQYKPQIDDFCEKLDHLRSFSEDQDTMIEKFQEMFPKFESPHIKKCDISNDDLNMILGL